MQAPLHRASLTKLNLAALLNIARSYKVLVFLRFFIAIVGGYAFTSASIALLSVVLPIAKQDAVLLCVSISILIYAAVFIYAFSVKSLKTVWISILLSISFFVVVLALLKGWL
ncbi:MULTISPECIES: hypothetical protein [unclassified Pseudoalteromonas]|jgi:hydrogenase-4 membrane subunit HyfE|uniref:hypothetical protein n=1 Tax=unclassified Pseudoalteromonas TaxID=194690 RepID=UPI002573CDE1|nr:hypothetical protein [Pseudoalteromonas sp. MM1]BED91437.1 hypothetical protein PspMM1_39050 [Pseudoalteromonas sp. MM1]